MVKLDGYELIIGSSSDAQFGPVLLFGAGGQLVEVAKDSALALPPLNSTLARRMMEQTRIYTALKGVRGRPPVDLAALEDLLVRFSELVPSSRGSRKSTSTRCWPRRSACWRWTRAWCCTTGKCRRTNCPGPRFGRIRRSMSGSGR